MFLRPALVLLTCAVVNVDNARILGLFHVPSYSHHIIGKTLLKALAGRGHQVTMISPFPMKTPIKNYEDIYLDGIMKFKEEGARDMMKEAKNKSVFSKIAVTQDIVIKMQEIFLNHTLVKDLLTSTKSFDLVIMDWVFNDAVLGIPHHYRAPVIIVSASGSSVITNKVTANPSPYAYVPNNLLTSIDETTFLDRVINTFSTILVELYDLVYHEPTQKRMLQQYFPNAPPLKQLIQNISLVFLNSDVSIESPRPYVPSMIQIAGLHIQEPKMLQTDLKKFMDEAAEGVLYFSLGGNVKSFDLPAEKIEAVINTFRKLPVKVLWKTETEDVSKLPPNVRTEKWVPQTDVLAHPNLKVFVTHGGWLSTTEAVFRGVPMVGIPCYGDQMVNVKYSVYHGYSTTAALEGLTEETLTEAIMEVLNNPRYRENIKKRSLWLRDQPIKPLDKAIFWVEYVLRHRGASHLQTSAVKLGWYQYLLLDVFAFLTGVLATTVLTLSKIVKLLKGLIYKNKDQVREKNKKD